MSKAHKTNLIDSCVWSKDEEALRCESCQNEFLVYRRRHHCRNCGGVFCGECCHARIPLPQLGINSPVRVCLLCIKVAHTVGSALSHSDATRLTASQNLARLTATPECFPRLLQYGGIEAASSLLLDTNPEIQCGAAMALYHVTRDHSEHVRLADKGVIGDLLGVVRRRKADDTTMKHCLGGLCLCASTASVAPKLVEKDGLRLLMTCASDKCTYMTSRILAIRIILALSRQEHIQEAIVMDKYGSLKRLVGCLELPEEDLVVVTAQSLAFLSTGTDAIKARIIQCDTSMHSMLCTSANKWKDSVPVLSNICCTLANLASVVNESSRLLIAGSTASVLSSVADAHLSSYEIQRHCGRGLGNLSALQHNAARIFPHMGNTVTRMLESPNVTVRSHALRVVDNLTDETMPFDSRKRVAMMIRDECRRIEIRLQNLAKTMAPNRTGKIAADILDRLDAIENVMSAETDETTFGSL